MSVSGYGPRLLCSLVAALALQLSMLPTAMAATSIAAREREWSKIQNKGTTALDANEYWIAEPTLYEALNTARYFGPSDEKLAHSLGELGRLYTVRGRFDKAAPFLERELEVRRLSVDNDTSRIIPSVGSLIRFYLEHGDAKKAEPLTDEVLFFVEGKMREVSEEAKGRVKKEKGAPLVGWAGTAAPVARDPLLEWSITCDQLGHLYSARGEFDLAERFFKVALDLKATILGKKHLSLANSYDNLGSLCMMRNEPEDAASYFKDALEITEHIQPPGHWQVYSRIDKLARCYIEQKNYKEAEALYKRAVEYNRADPSHNGNEARALYALGNLYLQQRNFAAAAPLLRRALNMSERINGSASVALVPYLQRYAYALYYLGQRSASENLKARATNINPVTPALKPAVRLEAGDWDKKITARNGKPTANAKSEKSAANARGGKSAANARGGNVAGSAIKQRLKTAGGKSVTKGSGRSNGADRKGGRSGF